VIDNRTLPKRPFVGNKELGAFPKVGLLRKEKITIKLKNIDKKVLLLYYIKVKISARKR